MDKKIWINLLVDDPHSEIKRRDPLMIDCVVDMDIEKGVVNDEEYKQHLSSRCFKQNKEVIEEIFERYIDPKFMILIPEEIEYLESEKFDEKKPWLDCLIGISYFEWNEYIFRYWRVKINVTKTMLKTDGTNEKEYGKVSDKFFDQYLEVMDLKLKDIFDSGRTVNTYILLTNQFRTLEWTVDF